MMLFKSSHLFIDIAQYILEGFFFLSQDLNAFFFDYENKHAHEFKFLVILFCYLVCLLIE